jgi:hypothetical protein
MLGFSFLQILCFDLVSVVGYPWFRIVFILKALVDVFCFLSAFRCLGSV